MAKALTARVVKAITMLGSTQGLTMVCSVVRMKILSLLVGPLGVGLMGALTQAADLVSNLTQLNIRTTAVPQLATASPGQFNAILICVRRYGRLLGCVGTGLMFILAPWMSQFTFGTDSYAWAYRIVALSLLFQALQGAELIVLQATSRYRPIAASGLFTAVTGLLIAVALYYGLREDGVAPSIVGYSIFAWLGAMWFTRRHRVSGPRPPWRDSLALGRGFIAVGLLMTLTSLATDGVNFIFMAIVRASGSDALGLYQAGYQLVWRYTGLLFISFAMEFYPRLSKASANRRHSSLLLTHQSIVTTLMLAPCAALGIILAPLLIRLLYSESFLPVVPYVTWGMAAMAFRPLSLALSYSFLAAGRGRVFCLTEVISSLTGLACNTLGLSLGGFAGLGIALILWLAIDLAIMLIAARIAGAAQPRTRALGITAACAAGLTILAAITTI